MKSKQERKRNQESNQLAQKPDLHKQLVSPSCRVSINCIQPRAESQSSEESFETIAPSISATSADSSDADDTMDQGSSVPIELASVKGEYRTSNGFIHNEDEKLLAVPTNVSLMSNDSHDSAFHSIPFDNWETADEFGTEYERNCTDEEDSTDSFGLLQPRRNIMLGLDQFIIHSFDKDNAHGDPDSVHAVSGELDQVDGSSTKHMLVTPFAVSKSSLHQPLSIKCSSDIKTEATPRRRRITLPLADPQSPIPQYIHNKSRQARAAIKKKNAQAKEKYRIYLAYRARRRAEKQQRKSPIIIIPSNHRFKIMWDMATIALTFVSAYVGHIYIRDKSTYEWDWFVVFTNIWFFVDLLLNFFTEHRTADGTVMKTGREVWGRYLTTWFAIDALSLLPWERMFLRPIIQKQKRRNVVVKWFFRSKAVVKVTVSSKFDF